MNRPEPAAVQRIGIIGTGVIGGGWAAHFLRHGKDVVAFDPAPGAEAALRRLVAQTWPTMERLGLGPGAGPDRLGFAASPAEVAATVEVVQENAPERLDLKVRLYEEMDAAAAPEVMLLSSTSGFAMTEIQARCRHPERTAVGHPFNPPYLVPLVEVVGGARSDPAAVDWAMAFYRATGKYALRLSRELPGFVANRLQEAMWHEALHMVANGEATVDEIDAAIAHGPGLRWALMGPCLTFHLAGGQGGIGHMLDHFGPVLEAGWTRAPAPPLTPELRGRMVEGCAAEAAGRTIDDLAAERDAGLIAILEALARVRASTAESQPSGSSLLALQCRHLAQALQAQRQRLRVGRVGRVDDVGRPAEGRRPRDAVQPPFGQQRPDDPHREIAGAAVLQDVLQAHRAEPERHRRDTHVGEGLANEH
jgi:carnitine 3-dehydrogenase